MGEEARGTLEAGVVYVRTVHGEPRLGGVLRAGNGVVRNSASRPRSAGPRVRASYE